MNTRTKKLSTLCAALGGAGLARTGAMLALALGAAQAGATTYTVPLQFNLTLEAPTCSLEVSDGATTTANATTPVQATGPVVNLTPTDIAVINSPSGIVSAMSTLSPLGTVAAPGVHGITGFQQTKRVTTPPTVRATCTPGTPMTARISLPATAAKSDPTTTGLPTGEFQVGTRAAGLKLPIGMLMGIAKFGSVDGATGQSGTTANTGEPKVSTTAASLPLDILLVAAVYGNDSTTLLTASYAGTWTYTFNVNLDF